jgi:hypothetical protein
MCVLISKLKSTNQHIFLKIHLKQFLKHIIHSQVYTLLFSTTTWLTVTDVLCHNCSVWHNYIPNVEFLKRMGLPWPWSYGSWIYNYLCNQCLSPLKLWVRISIRARCTTLCDKVCQCPFVMNLLLFTICIYTTHITLSMTQCIFFPVVH